MLGLHKLMPNYAPVSIGSRRRRGWATRIAAPMCVLLAITLTEQVAVSAHAADPATDGGAAKVNTVAVHPVPPKAWAGEARTARGAARVDWPQGEATVEFSTISADGNQASPKMGRVKAGNLPVALARSGAKTTATSAGATVERARVTVYDRAATAKARVNGLLLGVGRADHAAGDGQASIEVSYAGFVRAYGGDWGTRLRLVAMPACALSTPERPECQTRQPLPTRNNAATRTVTTDTTVPAIGTTVLAVTAAASGDNGSFGATSLSQAGTWNVGAQTGDFNWSHSLRTPPATGGPAPKLSLSYASGSIDGRVSTSNNQGGWVGDGWEMWPGFIERKYASCADDNPSHKTGDQCWSGDNATMSLSGHAGDLIATGTANVYQLKRDDGTRVERLVDAGRGNGDDDNEYWKVTTTDGTQYFFGYHRLPNWASGNPETHSTWTVPVYGNNSGEPRATTPTLPARGASRRGGGTSTTSWTRTATR